MDPLTMTVLQKLAELRIVLQITEHAHGIGCPCPLCRECGSLADSVDDAAEVIGKEVAKQFAR